MKKIFIVIPFLLFANDFNNYKLEQSLIDKLKYNYQHNRIIPTKKDNSIKPIDQVLKLLPKYKNFLTEKYPNILKNYINARSNNYYNPTIFYFTSSSVPKKYFYNIILSISKLQNYFEIKNAEIYKTIDTTLLTKELKEIKNYREKNITIDSAFNNLNPSIRFDSKAFKKLKIDKVPVIAFAMCKESIYPSDCDIKYIIRGDVSLTKFFFLISERDPNYNPYYQVLIDTP